MNTSPDSSRTASYPLSILRACAAVATRRPAFPRIPALSILAGTIAIFCGSDALRGATVSESATAPTSNVLTSQLLFNGTTFNGAQDFTDNAGPPGQTFTISGSGDFQLAAITVKGVGNSGGSSGVVWNIQIGSVDSTTGAITVIDTESLTVNYTSNADYLTFSLGALPTLAANTTYEFSIDSQQGYYGFAGLYNSGTPDAYAGGTAFNNNNSPTGGGTSRTFGGFVSPDAYDRLFVVQGLALAPGKTWSGTVNGVWNTSTLNFTGQSYTDGDNVNFGDADGAGVNPPVTRNITIQAGGVSPGPKMVVNNSAGDYTFTGSINGAANATILTKTGTSAVTLAGSTDNNGLTAVVNGGTMIMAKASSSTVHALAGLSIGAGATAQLAGTGGDQIADAATVAVNGILDLNGNNEALDILSGSGTGAVTNSSATPGSNSTLTVGANNGGGVFGGVIQNGVSGGTVALVKTGTGTETLSGFNTYTGGTTVNGGTLALGAGGQVGALATGSTITVNANGVLRINATDALGYTTGATAPVNLLGGTMTAVVGVHATLAGLNMTAGTLTSTGAGDTTGNSNYIFDGTVTTSASSTPSTINAQGIFLRGLNGGVGSPVTFNVARGSSPVDLAISSTITDVGMGLTKTGNGVMALYGPGTMTGQATINQGTLIVANNTALGTGGVVLGGGTLQLQGSVGGTGAIGIKFIGGNGGGPVTDTEGVVPIANWNNLSGNVGANISLNDANGTPGIATVKSFSASTTYGTGSPVQLLNGYIDNTGGGVNVLVTGVPYGSYSVYAYFGSDGAGRTGSIELGNTIYGYSTEGNVNTYTPTTDTAGANPAANYALFTGVAGPNFQINQIRGSNNSGLMGLEIIQTASTITLANAVTVSADSKIDVTGAGAADISGLLTIGANTLSITGGSSGANTAYTLTLGDVGGVTLTGSPTFNVANNGTGLGKLVFNGIADSGGGDGLTKAGNGTLQINGAASYAGPTNINAGTLALGTSGSLAQSAQINIAKGATFDVSALPGAFILNPGLALVGSGSGTGTTRTVTGSIDAQFGSLVIPGDDGAGQLLVSANLILEVGATLQLSVAKSSAHHGQQPDLTDYSQLSIGGSGSISGSTLSLNVGTGIQSGDIFTIILTNSPVSGTFAGLPNLATFAVGGQQFEINYAYNPSAGNFQAVNGTEVAILAVPEPGSLALLLGGVGMFAGLRRFRRSG